MRYAVIGLLPAPLRNEAVRRGVGALPLRIRAEVWARETAVDVGGRLLGLVVLLGPLKVSLLACINVPVLKCHFSHIAAGPRLRAGPAPVQGALRVCVRERVVAEKRGGCRLRLREGGSSLPSVTTRTQRGRVCTAN